MKRILLAIIVIFGMFLIITNKHTTDDPRDACVIITNGFGHGSGVHIGNGFILTAGHCATIEGTWIVASDGRTYTIVDSWRDPYDEDIGFIKIRNKDIPSLRLGKMPEVGDDVHVIGTPLDRAISFSYTEGIVSRIYTNLDGWWYDAMIIDAATYPGNSGSPVVNDDNKIVGILVGGYIGYDNMSICEPVENIRWSLESFLEYLFRKKK